MQELWLCNKIDIKNYPNKLLNVNTKIKSPMLNPRIKTKSSENIITLLPF